MDGEEEWVSSPDLCVCSVSLHDMIPDASVPFFLITSTPEGKHVVHATWPSSMPAITVSQDADFLSMFLFPLLHHTAPFRVYAHIDTTGAPSAYRLKSVKRQVDAAVLNGTHMVKETELLTALCTLQRELYYAVQPPPPPLLLDAVLPPPVPVPCEGWVRPLRLAQHQALQWMHGLEHNSAAKTLALDPRVPISDTVAVDLQSQTLVCARTPMLPSCPVVDINAGVLTGDRGSGKTAVALALALSPHLATPRTPLTPYEALNLTPCPFTTLLVVPRHLIPCWKMELKACFPGAQVLVISNTREARVTKATVMASRLVLTTDHVVASIAAACAEETQAQLRYFRTTVTTSAAPGSIVPLHAFKWGRIIVDEALRKNALSQAKLHTDWWWCLCADAEKMHPYKLLQKLEFATCVPSDTWAGSLQARTQFVTRYMHALQQPERPSETWSDRVVWVELKPDEYMRYEAAKAEHWTDERLLKLCCGAPQDQPGRFMQPKPLADVAKDVALLHQTTMRALKDMNPVDLQVAEMCSTEVNHFTHFDKVVQELKAETVGRQCPVCVEDACTILTTCGHTYCWTCMFRTFKNESIASCPYCRRLLTVSDVYQVLPEGQVSYMGQKCAALIAMLSAVIKDTPDNIVVYVTWYGLAQQLSAWLEHAGIASRALSSRGVESALKAFEAGSARVLVLPYDYGEGLTLVCANHVVIYHASSQKDNDIALASVNRTGQTKPIHVHRFVAKGTLEASMLCQ